MALSITNKSIFDIEQPQAPSRFIYINPVNSTPVTNKGLAGEFAKKYPEANREWKKRRESDLQSILVEPEFFLTKDEYRNIICFFPTKIHHKNPSKLEYIEENLSILKKCLFTHPDYCVILMPLLGCGLNNLKATSVVPLIRNFANEIKQNVILCDLSYHEGQIRSRLR